MNITQTKHQQLNATTLFYSCHHHPSRKISSPPKYNAKAGVPAVEILDLEPADLHLMVIAFMSPDQRSLEFFQRLS